MMKSPKEFKLNCELEMATIFFDTCAINHLVKKGFDGNEIKEALSRKGRIPVLGRNTLYECARNYSNSELCKKIHAFIAELNSEYTLTRTQYLGAEELKLKTDEQFAQWCSIPEKNLIKETIRNLRSGNFSSSEITEYENQREAELKRMQGIWHPDYRVKSIHKEFVEKFDPYILYLFMDKSSSLALGYLDIKGQQKIYVLSSSELKYYDEIKKNLEKCKKLNEQQECEIIKVACHRCQISCSSSNDIVQLKSLPFPERIKRLFEGPESITILGNSFRQGGMMFSNDEISKFLQNPSGYPALQTWFHSIVWMGDSVRRDGNILAKDRFQDAIQLMEASYCATFVSEEKNLITGYGKCLNPDIELLHVDKFLLALKC